MVTLGELWDRLGQVTSLAFVASSSRPTGWNGRGSGIVEVECTGNALTFNESGTWIPVGGHELHFTNVFRWTLLTDSDHVRLEHLRFGEDHPVFLFDLALSASGAWQSVSPHVCREDCYAASLQLHAAHLDLRWTIEGPSKQEAITYAYSW